MFKICFVLFFLSKNFHYGFTAKCFECSSITGDCSENTCDGTWCVARIVQKESPETNIYTKECSSTNPNNPKPHGCIKVENSGTTAVSCGCQTDYCNSADSIRQFLENSTNAINGTKEPVSTLSSMSKTLMQKPIANYSTIVQNDNGLSVSCFECNSVKGDCIIGDCKGHWCKTSISEDANAGTKVVSKGCSTTHPNSVTYDGCVKVTSQAVTTISCGCRKSNFCNTAENVDAWMARPVPPPGNISSFETFINANVEPAETTRMQHAKRRCHCTNGASGCVNNECYGEICAWTIFDSDKTKRSTIGKAIHQYCAPGNSSKNTMGCDNPEYKVVNTVPDGTPYETLSRTCRCDSHDFCNNKSPSLIYSNIVSFLSLSVLFSYIKLS